MSREIGNALIRVSIGSLTLLDSSSLKMRYKPTTLYTLQYSPTGCLGHCRFCSQSIVNNVSKKFLSRITWYPVRFGELVDKLIERNKLFRRICIQSVLKKQFIQEIIGFVEYMRSNGVNLPVSIATTPVHEQYLEKLYGLGVDYLGVGLDTASPKLFRDYGKPYTWSTYWRFIEKAVEVFGERHVYVHLIVGLGEDPLQLYSVMEKLVDVGCEIALFPFVDPKLFKPLVNLEYYREAQIIRYMLLKGYKLNEVIDEKRLLRREVVEEIINSLDKHYELFLTSGCPYCNRPYYTETPRGPYYNIYSAAHFRRYKRTLLMELNKYLDKLNK